MAGRARAALKTVLSCCDGVDEKPDGSLGKVEGDGAEVDVARERRGRVELWRCGDVSKRIGQRKTGTTLLFW